MKFTDAAIKAALSELLLADKRYIDPGALKASYDQKLGQITVQYDWFTERDINFKPEQDDVLAILARLIKKINNRLYNEQWLEQ